MAIKKKVNTQEGDKVALFKLLADINRYRVMTLLVRSKKPLCVSEIASVVGMTHSSVSHLLGKLHHVDVVEYKKNGREAFYMLAKTPRAKQVVKLL